MPFRSMACIHDYSIIDFGANRGAIKFVDSFVGNKPAIKSKDTKKGVGCAEKQKFMSLVDRETGGAKSMFVHEMRTANLLPIFKTNIFVEASGD